jgi:integrase
MKAADITRQDVRDLLDGMVPKTPIMANRVLALLRKLYNFGLSRDMVAVSPCLGIERPVPERQRDRVLTYEELRRVWQAAGEEDARDGALVKLLLLTAQRSGEVRALAWGDLDLETAWWTIPAGRAKNKLAHRVPLRGPAIAILRELRALDAAATWVFPSRSRDGYRTTIHKVACRVRDRSGVQFIPHDLRRTVASYMTSFGTPRLVVSKILNHVEHGVTAVYDRHSYDREKRLAIDAWAAGLLEIVRPDCTRAAESLAGQGRSSPATPDGSPLSPLAAC